MRYPNNFPHSGRPRSITIVAAIVAIVYTSVLLLAASSGDDNGTGPKIETIENSGAMNSHAPWIANRSANAPAECNCGIAVN